MLAIILTVAVGALIAVVVAQNFHVRRIARDGNWHVYKRIWPSGQVVMRRLLNGRWEERALSEVEWQEYESRDAW